MTLDMALAFPFLPLILVKIKLSDSDILGGNFNQLIIVNLTFRTPKHENPGN